MKTTIAFTLLSLTLCSSLFAGEQKIKGTDKTCLDRHAPISIEVAQANGWTIQRVEAEHHYSASDDKEVSTYINLISGVPEEMFCPEKTDGVATPNE